MGGRICNWQDLPKDFPPYSTVCWHCQAKPATLAKTTILLDHGYHPETIRQALEQVYPEIMTKIQLEVSAKLSKTEKAAQGKSGFVPVAVRWVYAFGGAKP